MSREEVWKRYVDANTFVNEGLIRTPANMPISSNQRPDATFRTRREWMEGFLPLIGHPERAFPAIHVGGTSGKGSVSIMIAEILVAAGLKTGMHVSPYLQVATEKLWINRRYASASDYCQVVDELRKIVDPCKEPNAPYHGMVSVAICLEYFRRKAVDVSVIEVGVGGKHDLTNILDTNVAVITNIGLDHQRTLGPSLDDIAEHKVGIIHTGCRAVVFSESNDSVLLRHARPRCRRLGVPLRIVRKAYKRSNPLKMIGGFQYNNAALAVSACEEFATQYGITLTQDHIEEGLSRARLPARNELLGNEIVEQGSILIDGAHNPDKLDALGATLKRGVATQITASTVRCHAAIPQWSDIHLIYGSLESKANAQTIASAANLAEHANHVTITEPQVYEKNPASIHDIHDRLRQRLGSSSGTEPVFSAAKAPLDALAIARNRATPSTLIVVTGSIYLAGNIRSYFYPDRDVLCKQASWPER